MMNQELQQEREQAQAASEEQQKSQVPPQKILPLVAEEPADEKQEASDGWWNIYRVSAEGARMPGRPLMPSVLDRWKGQDEGKPSSEGSSLLPEQHMLPSLPEDDILDAPTGASQAQRKKEAAQDEEGEERFVSLKDLMPPPSVSLREKLKSQEEEEPDEEKDSYWNRVLTGNPDTVPDDVCSRAGADDASLSPGERHYRLCSSVNRSWVADYLGVPRENLRAGWGSYRAELAEALGVANDEQEVFAALSLRHREIPRRRVLRRSFERGYLSGLEGKEEEHPADEKIALGDEELRFQSQELSRMAYQQGSEQRRKWLPLAREVARSLDFFSAVEEDVFYEVRGVSSLFSMAPALRQMANMSEHERQIVFHVARSLFEEEEPKELLPTMRRAFHRGRMNLSVGLLNFGGYSTAASLQRAGSLVGGRVGRSLLRTSEGMDQYMNLFNDLKRLQQNEIHPLDLSEEASQAEKFLVEAAEGTPAAILSCCGGVGFGAILLSGVGDSVAEARKRAPEGTLYLQMEAGVLAGAVQAGIFKGVNRVGARVLENSITQLMKARGSGMAAYSLAGLNFLSGASLEGAKQLMANKAASATDLAMQELAARLEGTASNIDWQEYGSNLTDIETNMREAARVLPFVLIGSGKMSLRHFRSERAILGDEGLILRDWGIEDSRRRAIMMEQDIDRRTEMLRLELRQSARWQYPEFTQEAARALRLLNLDYFDGFRDEDVVREFLELPSEGSKVVRSEYAQLSMEEARQNPTHGMSRYNEAHSRPEKMKEVFELWNSWWRRSHIQDYTAPTLLQGQHANYQYWGKPTLDRIGAYMEEGRLAGGIVPRRMRNTGLYAPFAEADRRALLRDRVSEAQDLSYQFLMNVYSLDSLMSNPAAMGSTLARTEATRKGFLGEIGKAVLRVAMGMPREESLTRMDKYFSDYYLRRGYRGFPAAWMKEYPSKVWRNLPRLTKEYADPAWWNQPEMMQTFRIMSGARSCATALMDLLPMTDDFQTGLSRGMSPAQSFAHLLERELGYDPSAVKGYPVRELEASRNVTDFRRYTRDNVRQFRLYQQMTGVELEKQKDAKGVEYYRIVRPDGHPTRWHRGPTLALNDMAANTALQFAPFGDGHYKWMQRLSSQGNFDLLNLNRAEVGEFSGYDQLCGIATKELAHLWMDTATTLQPGIVTLRMRRAFRGLHNGDGVTPLLFERSGEGRMEDFEMDVYTGVTPLSLIQSRSYVYWSRMLNSSWVSEAEAADFLERQGVSLSEEPSRLEIVQQLSDFTTHYFLARLDQMNIPESVRRWYATAAFCPAPEPSIPQPKTPGQGVSVPVGAGGTQLISWANRYVARKLRDMAPEVERVRELPLALDGAEEPFLPMVMGAFGGDVRLRYEQGWCFHQGGSGVFLGGHQPLWNMMTHPLRAWELMTPEEQLDLRQQARTFCPDETGGDAVLESVKNLDAVLRDHPELHRYSLVDGETKGLRLMTLEEPRVDMERFQEPEMRPVPMYQPGEMQSGFRLEGVKEPPAFIQEDARVMPALRFLGGLRSMMTEAPCALSDGIWWNRRVYGGERGEHPEGLEAWTATRPLGRLLDMLGRIHDRRGGVVNVCGVRVRGLNPAELDLSELNAVTVYLSEARKPYTYRLMPGEPDAEFAGVREPYVVDARYGIFLDGKNIIHDAGQWTHSFRRLQDFHPTSRRLYKEPTLRTLSERNAWTTLHHIMDRLEGDHFRTGTGADGISMREILMRLCEDSGFLRDLAELEPSELTYGQAVTLNLSRALLLGTCYPDSPKYMGELIQEVKRLHSHPEEQRSVIEVMRDFLIDEEDIIIPEPGTYTGGQGRRLFPRPQTNIPRKKR